LQLGIATQHGRSELALLLLRLGIVFCSKETHSNVDCMMSASMIYVDVDVDVEDVGLTMEVEIRLTVRIFLCLNLPFETLYLHV
jgi:hypothetical protein